MGPRGTLAQVPCLLRRDVRAGEAAVDEEGRGGDVGAVVARQEERALGDLAGLGEAAHGEVDEASRRLLRILREQLLEQGGVDGAGAEGVDADAPLPELHS